MPSVRTMIKCGVKSSVTAYSSDPCREVNLTESDIYSSLRFPDIKLTRLENDVNCLKYLNSARKSEHLKSLFYNSDNVSSIESDSSLDDIDSTGSSVSDHENLSCDRFRKNSEFDEDYCEIIETDWNPHKNSLSRFFKSKVKNPNRFDRFPVIKLIRLENDENCYKYLKKTPLVKMPKKKLDKRKPSGIAVAPSSGVHRKPAKSAATKTVAQCDDRLNSSEESKDSCIETSINDSDCSQNSVNLAKLKRVSKKKLLLSQDTSPSEIDLITLDWTSSEDESPTPPSPRSTIFENFAQTIPLSPTSEIPENFDSQSGCDEVNHNSNQSEISIIREAPKKSLSEDSNSGSSCDEVNHNSYQSEICSIDEAPKKSLSEDSNSRSSCDEDKQNLNQNDFSIIDEAPKKLPLEESDSRSSCDEVNHNSYQSEIRIIDEAPMKSLSGDSDSRSSCDEDNQNSNPSDISIIDEAPKKSLLEESDSRSSCDEVDHNSNQSEIGIIDGTPNNSRPESRCEDSDSESGRDEAPKKKSSREKRSTERNTVRNFSISFPNESNNLLLIGPNDVITEKLADSEDDSAVNDEYFIIDFEFVNDDVFERLLLNAGKSEDLKPIQATCELCNDSFSTRSSLYNHMEQIHKYPNVYECAHCGELFSVKACLVYHLYAQLEDESGDICKAHICPQYLCSRENFTRVELEFLKSLCSNHSILHNQLPRSQDPSQNVALSSGDSNLNDDKTEDKQHPDDIEIKPTVMDQSPTELNTNICDRVSDSKNCNPKIFKRKIDVEKSDQNSKKSKSHDRSSDQNSCYGCSESFRNRKELFDHFVDGHNHIYYHECHLCMKLFHNSISFASHFIKKECHKIETSKPKLTCELCNHSYKTVTILRKHKMNIHNLYIPALKNDFIQFLISRNLSNSVLNCIFCYENHSCLSSLRDHEESSHSYYSCFKPWCSTSFSSRSELERHLFLHFSQGESSFCSFCSQLFFTKQILENHIQRHLRERNSYKTA